MIQLYKSAATALDCFFLLCPFQKRGKLVRTTLRMGKKKNVYKIIDQGLRSNCHVVDDDVTGFHDWLHERSRGRCRNQLVR